MITTIDITLLPADLQKLVLEKYRVALMRPEHQLTYEECAWLYGYTYQTIRSYVAEGRLKTVGRWPRKRISHAAMRNYLRKVQPGHVRKPQRAAQLDLV